MAECNVHYPSKTRLSRLQPLLMLAIFASIIAIAAGLRFWQLGARTFQGDETIGSLIANQVARGGGYEQLPVLHGPFQYFGTALAFHALGTNDMSARALPALFGVLLAALPFLFTRHIGRAGAVVASLMLAISPTMLYYSRFAGPEIYLAFFTLATAMLIWRYLAAPERVYLYLMAATLAFALVTSEMALVVVLIFAAYLHYRTGGDLVAQASAPRSSREPTHYDTLGVDAQTTVREIRAVYKQRMDHATKPTVRAALTEAMHVLTTANRRQAYDRQLVQRHAVSAAQPEAASVGVATRVMLVASAGAVATLWPLLGGVRRRLHLKRLPDAASPLLVITLLTLPFFGPLVEKLPFVGDRGFDGQQPVFTFSGTPVVTPGGELPVMLVTLGVLFAAAAIVGMMWRWHVFVICWAMFYGITITLFTGFFTNKGGVWTGHWGTLDYWWRPEARHADGPAYFYAMTLPAYEIVPIGVGALGLASLMVRGGWRNRIVVAATCATMAAIIGAPGWLRPVAEHRTLLLLMSASLAVLLLRTADLTKFLAFWTLAAFLAFTVIGRKDAALAIHIVLPLSLLAAKLAGDAIASFEMPAIVLPAMPRLQMTPTRRFAQAGVVAAVGAGALFTARTGVLATWGHGALPRSNGVLVSRDRGDAPVELLHADEIAPDVQEVRAAIQRAGNESGQGTKIPIAIDTSFEFAKGWLWYLRDYPNLQIEDMRKGYTAPAGTIVLFDSRNRGKIQVDATSASLAFTSKWDFPGKSNTLSRGEVAADLRDGGWWSQWSRYLLEREPAGQPDLVQGMAYFPQELSAALPHSLQSDVLISTVEPQPQGPPAP